MSDLAAVAPITREAIEAAGAKPLDPPLHRIAAIGARQDLVALLVSLEPDGGAFAPPAIVSEADPDNAEQTITGIPAGAVCRSRTGIIISATTLRRRPFAMRLGCM